MITKAEKRIDIGNENGDIPWDQIDFQVILDDISWLAPTVKLDAAREYIEETVAGGRIVDFDKVHELAGVQRVVLRSIRLANGIRYVEAINPETGSRVYNRYELRAWDTGKAGCTTARSKAPEDADLGNGYTLFNFDTFGREKPFLQSAIQKTWGSYGQREKTGPAFELFYRINPLNRNMFGYFSSWCEDDAITINMDTRIEEEGKMANQKLTYTISTGSRRTNNQIDFRFKEEGQLAEIRAAGVKLRGIPGATPEPLAISPRTQRGIVSLLNAQIAMHEARNLIRGVLGVKFEEELVLDTQATLDELVASADSNDLSDPRQKLVFKNANRAAGRQGFISLAQL